MPEIRSLIKQHSRFQVEIKNHYPIKDKNKNHYDLNIYLVSPFTLDINNNTYSRNQILSDIHIYTRYTIYETSLAELIHRKNEQSPLRRVETLIQKGREYTASNMDRINYEFRILANVFLYQLDQQETYFRERINDGVSSKEIKPEVILLTENLDNLICRFRDLNDQIDQEPVPSPIQIGYSLADESISLSIERVLFPLLNLFNDREGSLGKKKIKQLLKKEMTYRKGLGYAIIENNPGPLELEKRVYRESILKKWAQSVNYMDKKGSTINKSTSELLAAIAAAIAMSFAVLATVYANRFFVIYSLPWIVVAIFSYSLKDRIKEALRTIFKRLLPRMISDRTDNLYDMLINKPIGRARLTVEHKKGRDLSPELTRWYKRGDSRFLSILPQGNILNYRRQISLNNSLLRKYHTRMTSITEVFRINLEKFVKNMDDPDKDLWFFNGDVPTKAIGTRVYKLKFAVQISQDGKEIETFYSHVFMDQNGIIRVEKDRIPPK